MYACMVYIHNTYMLTAVRPSALFSPCVRPPDALLGFRAGELGVWIYGLRSLGSSILWAGGFAFRALGVKA